MWTTSQRPLSGCNSLLHPTHLVGAEALSALAEHALSSHSHEQGRRVGHDSIQQQSNAHKCSLCLMVLHVAVSRTALHSVMRVHRLNFLGHSKRSECPWPRPRHLRFHQMTVHLNCASLCVVRVSGHRGRSSPLGILLASLCLGPRTYWGL